MALTSTMLSKYKKENQNSKEEKETEEQLEEDGSKQGRYALNRTTAF